MAGASPSATWRRRSPRCARLAWMAPRWPRSFSPESFPLVSTGPSPKGRPMRYPLIILLVLAMGATAYVLVRGVIAMASGKDVTGEQQQNWMRKRVLFQAVAIAIVILILVVAGSAGR